MRRRLRHRLRPAGQAKASAKATHEIAKIDGKNRVGRMMPRLDTRTVPYKVG